jgi:hypothetical protein
MTFNEFQKSHQFLSNKGGV